MQSRHISTPRSREALPQRQRDSIHRRRNSLQQGLFLAIQRALDDNQADILNVSFGECESAVGASGNQYIQNLWEQAARKEYRSPSPRATAVRPDATTRTQNVANQGLAVNALSATPYNISVGGTDFDILYSNFPASFVDYVNITNTLPDLGARSATFQRNPGTTQPIQILSVSLNLPLSYVIGYTLYDNIIAGGGGISSIYPMPSWQAGFATGSGRNLPDVSSGRQWILWRALEYMHRFCPCWVHRLCLGRTQR